MYIYYAYFRKKNAIEFFYTTNIVLPQQLKKKIVARNFILVCFKKKKCYNISFQSAPKVKFLNLKKSLLKYVSNFASGVIREGKNSCFMKKKNLFLFETQTFFVFT